MAEINVVAEIFGEDKLLKPMSVSLSLGTIEMKRVPALELQEWDKQTEKERKDMEDETLTAFYLQKFGIDDRWRSVECDELAASINKTFTQGDMMCITRWYLDLLGLTFEEMIALSERKNFRRGR